MVSYSISSILEKRGQKIKLRRVKTKMKYREHRIHYVSPSDRLQVGLVALAHFYQGDMPLLDRYTPNILLEYMSIISK
jgi:hypothetical protein